MPALPSPDEIKARIDALVAKRDLAELWGVYFARQVGGSAGEDLLVDVMDRGEDALRGIKGANAEIVDSLRRSADSVSAALITDLSSVVRRAESSDKVQDLVGSVRNLWSVYPDEVRQWIGKNWPDARPDGPAAADVELPDLEADRS